MRTAILLLLGCFSAWGQALSVRDLALVGQQVAVVGGETPWDPSSVSGAYLDYWAQSINAANGDRVITLTNRIWSGGSLHQIATSGSRPYWTNNGSLNNGKAFVAFDAVDDYMSSAEVLMNQPVTVFMFARISRAVTSYHPYFDATNTSKAFNIHLATGTPTLVRFESPTTRSYTSYGNLTNWMLISAVFNGANSYVYTNGVSMGAAANPGSESCTGLVMNVFKGFSSTYAAGLHLGRAIFYTNTLSATDRTNVEYWFKTNYNAW